MAVDDDLEAEAAAPGDRLLARLSRGALAATIELAASTWDLPAAVRLQREGELIRGLVDHPDHAEGLSAFGEKRRPNFE